MSSGHKPNNDQRSPATDKSAETAEGETAASGDDRSQTEAAHHSVDAVEESSVDSFADLEALAEEARAQRDTGAEFTDATGAEAGQPVPSVPRRRQPVAPAEGERNAVVGYLGQYEYAAMRTLSALREGTLGAVRVADVSAGQIDDFQLRSSDRVDAHQVKWSLLPGNVGYAEFQRDAVGRTRYIRQLADGWERLSALHQPRRVVVHFVTNDLPTTASSPSIPRPDERQFTGSGRTWSFAAFLAEAWQPAVEAARRGDDPAVVVPTSWAPAMRALADASGLDANMWRLFIADCELEFGVPSVDGSIAATPLSDRERTLLRSDADRLAHAFMQFVARPDRRVEWSRDELLDQLGWRFRTEFRNTHEFPDPDIPYRSIATTAREVTEAIERLTSGYLAIVGSPGSGKSTLLTRTLRESAHRVVRYYAYVRDSVGGSLRRGEATNFFHDLTVALDRAGLPVRGALPYDDLDLLIGRVASQLELAQAEAAGGGRRTIILIDGLDHIPREQHPTQSLLAYLPHPEDVPEGVLIVLGTQTDRLQGISPRIREHLDQQGRRIAMRLLERSDVLEIVEAASDLDPVPSAAERERIHDLSGGHPLALSYIINRLRHARGEVVADTLDAVEPFSEGIDRQYATLWGIVEDDAELSRLLALLARARGPVRLEWVRRWAARQALHALTTRLAYLFRQEHGGRWTFFHNSFRAFLVERTRDVPSLGSDEELFTELAAQCAAAGAQEPERADELFYRARAGDSTRVLALAQPETLRVQFVAGRSATTIGDDLALALDAAVAKRDMLALTRVLLCSAEFVQRDYYADLLPLAETWLELGDVDLALGALREGAALRTTREDALRAAAALDGRGFAVEAMEVFTLAEPLDVLRGSREQAGRRHEERELLDAWIEVAPRFRSLSAILDLIERSVASADEVWVHGEHERAAADAEASSHRQYHLLQGLAISLDALRRHDDADVVRASLRGRHEAAGWWFWAQSIAWSDSLAKGDRQRAEERFGALREAVEGDTFPLDDHEVEARVALAAGHIRVAGDMDAARRLVDGVEQPALVTDLMSGQQNGWRPFHPRYALNRVLGALSDERPFAEVVPDPPSSNDRSQSPWDEGTALVTQFERGVAHLGRLSGQGWIGRRLAPSDFEAHARQLIRLFPDQPQLIRGGYVAIRAREEFYTRLVQVAEEHGSECVAVVQRLLDTEWSDPVRRDAWPNALVRALLTVLLRSGASADWVRTNLARVEPWTFRGEDLETELSEGIKHVRACASVGDIVAARACLERVLRATFGNEAKDDQLSACLKWARSANREDPSRAPERLAHMAAAVLSLDGAEAQSYVASKLIEAGVEAGARPGRTLVEWALRNDIHGWVDALTILIEQLASHAPAASGALSAFFRSLVLPFARTAEVDAVTRLGAALRTTMNPLELDALSDAIEVVALGSTRPALREALRGRAEEAAELLRDQGVIDPTAPGQVVDAFEGLSLTLRELQHRVQTVADVQDLAQRLKPNAYSYRWELILSPFVARASAEELVAAAAAIPQNDYAWKVLATIAERLIALRDPRARTIVDRVVQSSRAAGWWPRYDGGSRLAAFELLVSVAGEEGRGAAWEALRSDIAAGEVRSIDVFRGWHRVVAMLSPTTPAVDMWDVVAGHVAALVQYAPQGERLVLPAADDPRDVSAAVRATCSLAACYLDHPATALAQGAQQFFTDRLLSDDAIAEAILAARLSDDTTPNDGVLLVLRAVALVRSSISPVIREALLPIRNARHYSERRSAIALIDAEEGVSSAPSVRSTINPPLPGPFRIVHPPAKPRRRRPLPGRGEMLPPAEDAADLVSIFRSELDLVARWANVQPEALYHYVAELSLSHLPEGSREYAFDDEPALRDEMRRLGLEVPYRRPRPRRVERAMAEATAMLVDHGRLHERYLSALDRMFRNSDPYFLVARPTRRPESVAAIPERAVSKYVDKDWTSAVSESSAIIGRNIVMPVRAGLGDEAPESRRPSTDSANVSEASNATEEEWVVLAEETWVRWLDWKYATECRVGVRLEPKVWSRLDPERDAEEAPDADELDGDIAASRALDRHLVALSHLTADEYLTRAKSSDSIVVRNYAYRFESPGGRWLALNPALAEHLGWRPARDGMFRWLDAEGKVVAESVWWQDGFAHHRPPIFEDEVGHGWLLLVTVRGWRQLAAEVGECVDWSWVFRLAREQPPAGVEAWDADPHE